MFNFGKFVALFGLLLCVFAKAENPVPYGKSKLFLLVERASTQANLQETEVLGIDESTQVATNSLRSVEPEQRFFQGFVSGTIFRDVGFCAPDHFSDALVHELNVCYATSFGSEKWRLWKTQKGNLGITVNQWSDHSCGAGWKKMDFYVYDNRCTPGVSGPNLSESGIITAINNLDHVWLPQQFGALPAFIEYPNNDTCKQNYNSQNNHGPAPHFIDINVYRTNLCYDGEGDRPDVMYTGCSTSSGGGITGNLYSSKHGECTGSPQPFRFNPSHECTSTDPFGTNLWQHAIFSTCANQN